MEDCDEITRKDFILVAIALQRKIDVIVGVSLDIEETQTCYTPDETQISMSNDRMITENNSKIVNAEFFSSPNETMFENIHHNHERDHALIKITFEICTNYQEEKVEPHILEQQTNSIKECISETMPPQVIESLEKLSPSERFLWCAILLIKFHFETECSEFMSCAFKFILKVLSFKFRYSNIHRDTDIMCSLFTYYSERIRENNCDAYVIVNAIKVFLTTEDSKTFFFRNEVDMEYILKSCQAVNFNVFRFFGSVMYTKETPLYLTDFSLHESRFDNFKALLQFGVVDYYNSKYCNDLREVLKKSQEDYIFVSARRCYSKKTLRLRQYYCHSPDHKRNEVIRVLKYLWVTTPEPYFGISEFHHFFQIAEVWFSEMIWQWYEEHVIKGEIREKSPRSLLHLSRCAIRSCLALNFQLPEGVESLHLPQNLKDYLQLKECEKDAPMLED